MTKILFIVAERGKLIKIPKRIPGNEFLNIPYYSKQKEC